MITNRLAKVAIAAVAVGAPLLTASAALASTHSLPNTVHPDGFVAVATCSNFSGQITYSPGLRTTTLKREFATISGTLSNCQNGNGAQVGTGTVNGIITGQSSLNSKNLSGLILVSWPGSNPSAVNVSLKGTNQGADTLSGSIVTGAYTGGQFRTSLLAVSNTGTGIDTDPVKSQVVTNTAPIQALQNFG